MKYSITTLGCKVNQYETQAIDAILQERGHSSVESEADAVIVNTCAVTAESGRKSRQAVRRIRQENPGALVVICGCFSQVSPEEARNLDADIIYGTGDKIKLIDDLEAAFSSRRPVENIDDPFKRMTFERLPAGAVDGRTRAMLKVQDGCDNFCTYCIIPYARGRVRSLSIEDAAKQARELAAQGFKEIVITGIEIASYGKDFKDGSGLIDVIEAVALAVPDLRIRLGSLEPTIVTRAFCSRLRSLGNVCAHFHLSLQSGSDATLKAMKRKYTTKEFFAVTELLREFFPNCALTADLIAGFPEETDGEHHETLVFIEKCRFSSMHIFPYSIRPGTKAADMKGQHNKAVKSRRAREAQAVASRMQRDYLESCVGKTVQVLFETSSGEKCIGHADNYCAVSAEGEHLRGFVKRVEITSVSGEMLVGKII